MLRTRVGILRGGNSSEADLSLGTGAAVLNALPEEQFDSHDIFIDKHGDWFFRGVKADPIRVLHQFDCAFNALHGGVGEDGTVARILERANTPFTGSLALPSLQSLNKELARSLMGSYGIPIPRGLVLTTHEKTTNDAGEMARHVFSHFGPPYILKPLAGGASEGIRVARTFIELGEQLESMAQEHAAILVEEFLRGVTATVGVIENFREQPLYALPVSEIFLPEGHLFIPSSAHRDGLPLRTPAPGLSQEKKKVLMHLAKEAHKALGLKDYSRSDFIITPRGIFLLEINALPGLYPKSPFADALETVGSSVPEFVQHLVRSQVAPTI